MRALRNACLVIIYRKGYLKIQQCPTLLVYILSKNLLTNCKKSYDISYDFLFIPFHSIYRVKLLSSFVSFTIWPKPCLGHFEEIPFLLTWISQMSDVCDIILRKLLETRKYQTQFSKRSHYFLNLGCSLCIKFDFMLY